MWRVRESDDGQVARLAQTTGAGSLVARLMWLRGIRDPGSARCWLKPDLGCLHDPSLLPDFDPAVERIDRALKEREPILIWGHDDLDGITAVAVLKVTLERLGGSVRHYIPAKGAEKYGLNPEIVDIETRLVITADCGITNWTEVAELAARGVDVLVTDHHEVTERMPDAVALVNPKRPDSVYPFRGLAGAGVALKLAMGMMRRSEGWSAGDFYEQVGDCVALALLGTIGDRVPLTGENRTLVATGMRCLEGTQLPAIRAVIGRLGGWERLTVAKMVHGLLPLFAAADSKRGVDRFLGSDPELARRWTHELTERARQWRSEAEDSYALAERYLEASDRVVVVRSEELSLRALGFCAGRLREKFGLPVLVMGWRGDAWVGECRGVEGMSLIDLLKANSDCLLDYGGHRQAGGFTVLDDRVEELTRRVFDYAEEHYAGFPADNSGPVADAVLPFADFDEGLKTMAPFGHGNPMPVFISEPTDVTRQLGTYVPSVRPELVLHKGRPDLAIGAGVQLLLYTMDDEGVLSVLDSMRA